MKKTLFCSLLIFSILLASLPINAIDSQESFVVPEEIVSNIVIKQENMPIEIVSPIIVKKSFPNEEGFRTYFLFEAINRGSLSVQEVEFAVITIGGGGVTFTETFTRPLHKNQKWSNKDSVAENNKELPEKLIKSFGYDINHPIIIYMIKKVKFSNGRVIDENKKFIKIQESMSKITLIN